MPTPFTLKHANHTLVLIRLIVAEVQSLWLTPIDEEEAQPRLDRLKHCLEELNQLGVVLRDLSSGQIDFPGIDEHGSALVWCWNPKDPGILYWHEAHELCALKKAITLKPSEELEEHSLTKHFHA